MARLASCYVLESDGTWRRRGRGNLDAPAPPTNVTGTGGTGTATLSWTASTTPGVTYVVKRVSWPVTVWSGSATTAVITGLTVYPSYTFQVFAVLGDLTSAPSNTVTVNVSGGPPSTQRFPGDPNPTANGGRLYWGCSMKGDVVPTTYETDTGVAVGCRHRYWSDSDGSSLAKMLNGVGVDHSANRFPIYSWRLAPTQWVAAAGGSLDGPIDAFISGAAKLAKPLAWIVNHEPDGGNGNGQPDGPAPDYQNWMRHVRSRITHWETVNGTSHPTLSFWGCWIGTTFTGSAGGPNTWWPGAGVFDVLGVDRYAQNNSYTTLVNAQWTAIKNFMATNSQTFAVTEWGINPGNPNGVSIMTGLWNDATSGSVDCVAMSYFSPNGAWQFSAGEQTQFETYMKDAKAIHMSDLGY